VPVFKQGGGAFCLFENHKEKCQCFVNFEIGNNLCFCALVRRHGPGNEENQFSPDTRGGAKWYKGTVYH